MSIPIGGNYWSLIKGVGGLAVNNANIEHGYPFQELRQSENWHDDMYGAIAVLCPSSVRVPLILAERDPVETRFGHIPPPPKEAELVREFLINCPIPRRQLTIVRCWEAVWMGKEQGIAIGENPFDSPIFLADALVSTVEIIVGEGLPEGVSIDLDCESVCDEADSIYLPRAAAICKSAGIPWTVSSIVEPNGFIGRVTEMNRYLESLGLVPDFVQFHWNGALSSQIEDNAEKVVNGLRMGLPHPELPLVLGECDCDLDAFALGELLQMDLDEIFLWQ